MILAVWLSGAIRRSRIGFLFEMYSLAAEEEMSDGGAPRILI
jgi:hypothetical protein